MNAEEPAKFQGGPRIRAVFGLGGRRHRRRRQARLRPLPLQRLGPPVGVPRPRTVYVLRTATFATPTLDRLRVTAARYEAQLCALAVRAQRRVAFPRRGPW